MQSPGSCDAGLLDACRHGPPGVWEDVPGMLKAPGSASQHPQPREFPRAMGYYFTADLEKQGSPGGKRKGDHSATAM